MTPSARLSAVVELLDISFNSTGRAEQSVGSYFRARRYAGSKDRRWITEQFFQILRRLGELDFLLEELDLAVNSRNRAILSLMVFNALPLAEIIAGYFTGTHALQEPDDADIAKFTGYSSLDFNREHLLARKNFPQWMLTRLERVYDSKLTSIVKAYADRAPVTLRVNPLKADRDSVLEKLAKQDIPSQPTDISPLGIRLQKPQNLSANALYKEGYLEIQDEAAQISALLAGAKPDSKVIDYCAGGGGKSLVLAASMENRGKLYAFDINSRRMKDIAERCQRAGIDIVEQYVLSEDKQNQASIEKLLGAADLVYVDAPCTGSGTWRRQPEQKWILTEEQFSDYVTLQRTILADASHYVKVGGQLVYATCSIFAEENAEQIDLFLSEHSNFERTDVSMVWQGAGLQQYPIEGPDLQITPDQFGADGFYSAILRRVS
ncbi:RsmB/NOP family class I SAM-dependent RNA methyltransferase [Sneathiella glossodoripedis]|uniref:RsmB/NOP family class I SAM-dependent RNA methyltransferase n=1 Tax=Sneathiella glossodoripedis TaxID=418853 RepID=UPI00046EC302|nr:RsmB/NOP family class I SAM-dependent RNA methyltransferase [Sneathiella glossodoripedis]